MTNMKIGLTETIHCAHFIEGHPKCGEVHGHSYKIEITLNGSMDSTRDPDAFVGMLVDFGDIKNLLRKYDHKCLNDFFNPPTAEMFTIILCFDISQYLRDTENSLVDCITVRVYETETSWAEENMKISHDVKYKYEPRLFETDNITPRIKKSKLKVGNKFKMTPVKCNQKKAWSRKKYRRGRKCR